MSQVLAEQRGDLHFCRPRRLIPERTAGELHEDGLQVGFLELDRGDADTRLGGGLEQARQNAVAVLRAQSDPAALGFRRVHGAHPVSWEKRSCERASGNYYGSCISSIIDAEGS